MRADSELEVLLKLKLLKHVGHIELMHFASSNSYEPMRIETECYDLKVICSRIGSCFECFLPSS